MKIKKGFEKRFFCGEHVIMAHGIENLDFSQLITVNESASYLWDNCIGKDFSEADLVALLLKEYDVSEQQAQKDIADIVALWKKLGLVED